MAERLRQLPQQILDWWNKFTPKQKTIIVSAVAAVVLTISILAYVLTRPDYIVIARCESAKEASQITTLLDGEGITNKTSEDALTVYVLKADESKANLVLGANDIPTVGYSISDVTEGGFSTTEADKQKRYVYYKESKLETDLKANENIKEAHVTLTVPEDDGTLIAQKTASSASVVLELDGEMDSDQAAALAHFIATALGNETTDNITIIDTVGNLLYSGEIMSGNGGVGGTSTQLAAKTQAEQLVKNEVRGVLLGTNLYDSIEVATNLELDFSSYERTRHDYSSPEGSTQGLMASEDLYNSESSGSTGGVPGTDSNGEDGTTYVIQNQNDSSQTVTEESRKYLPNEFVEKQTVPAGLIKYDSSSISVTAKKLKVIKQEDIEAQGLLVDMSWDEYKSANGEQTKLEVDQDLYNVVQTATGIARENITIVAYEVPTFLDKEGGKIKLGDIVLILLIVLILGLLAFVVIRSMRSQKEEEPEEELSVESLLQSTPEEELEDLELEGKSEERILIEKFVDENPEAVANLLRNWLTEEW
ncbi:MAG: flagellar M-ring protein FliF [Lachnospiraceae bacterium]|nr:flagellar M-ring protein FliF [Lachnospiraceae bacterium]